jgi:heme/copper-type cytochrome/quinol oxidase subunit 3
MSHATDHPPSPFPGVKTTKFAMWVFLASEVMFFAGLIAAYIVLRLSHGSWPVVSEILNVPLVAANTFILIVSSLTMVRSLAAIEDGNERGMRLNLIATAVLGIVFLSIQAFEWSALSSEGTGPSTDLFGSVFYTLTGFHGLHVLLGVLALVFTISKAMRGRFTQNDHGGVELMGLYWHFVDVVWIFLFTILYLI